ncbi:cellulose synthase complex periplasmic endoglucanase BcsZ [Xenophilus arseniciresistens]|uniref:Glucanase n=1 Tax=Xenophilus arseniciresistens TaxID=1283306 RepID=A0AAE3N6Y6_9BURK|nr:cellulose synthase complex periplasmic endoglucanase BcsZ [Xenophilus arseniciresistens]MDA7415674.1 cellulose synthase complex periplasmic endoglucanase BcsZ [Xenophilus arseniciresistens]
MTLLPLPTSTGPQGLRRRQFGSLALLGLGGPLASAALAAAGPGTPRAGCGSTRAIGHWQAFLQRHVQPDGRVIDFDTPAQHSTSEGQSYTLFFALVHNDRPLFDRVLAWTQANLSGGSLASRLPAWQWGRLADGKWGVMDGNAASDGDLWIAYALLEAGRLWNAPAYRTLGRQLLARVVAEEVVTLEGLGAMLLPWPRSVAQAPNWRLNPSYLCLQQFRRFQLEDPKGPWREIADNSVRLLGATAPRGYSPDWCVWSTEQHAFLADPEKGHMASYDAIRVYLWAGMLAAQDPARATLLDSLSGPRRVLEAGGALPEYVDTRTGATTGQAPAGFYGACLPYLRALGQNAALGAALARIDARGGVGSGSTAAPLPYYERTLILFGLGWLDGHFAFDRQGQLQPSWTRACNTAAKA